MVEKKYNFYEKSEVICNDYFYFLNDNLKWFTTIERNELTNKVDFKCINRTGTTCNVELKIRQNDINTFNDIFIEEKKYKNLMNQYKLYNIKPLYINWFIDKYHFIVFDLSTISKMTFYPDVKIYDKGDGNTKYENRYGLYARNGSYYIYNNNKKLFEKKW